jgi:hypothetical protein
MAYLNSDDLLLSGSLHYVANFFATHPDVDVVYGHRILINEQDKEIGRWILPRHDNEILSWADYIPQETLFWRRRIWDRVGGSMDDNFQFALDWELLLRFRDVKARFVRLPRFLGAFRVHAEQKTATKVHEIGQEEMFRLRARCAGRTVTSYEVAQRIIPYMRWHRLYVRLYQFGLVRY